MHPDLFSILGEKVPESSDILVEEMEETLSLEDTVSAPSSPPINKRKISRGNLGRVEPVDPNISSTEALQDKRNNFSKGSSFEFPSMSKSKQSKSQGRRVSNVSDPGDLFNGDQTWVQLILWCCEQRCWLSCKIFSIIRDNIGWSFFVQRASPTDT